MEAIRACAATMVVFYHVARHLDKTSGTRDLREVTQFGHAGVDLFFVISGFVILFVHSRDVGRPARLRHYASRRLSRVIPTYWVALFVTVILSQAGGHAFPALLKLICSLSLLPSTSEPILGVAWTLQYEILFYAVFGLLIIDRSIGPVILAMWLGWILADWAGLVHSWPAIPYSMYGTYNLEFFMGMGVAFWLRRSTVVMPAVVLMSGVVLFGAVAAAENCGIIDGYAASARLAYGIPSVLLVLGVVEAERSGKLSVPSWLRSLGSASYSIYLFQFVFIGVAWQLWLDAGWNDRSVSWLAYAFLVGAALIGGFAMSRLVEQPLLRLVRGDQPVSRAIPLSSKTAV